jgi:hypothetical protein
MAEFQLTPVEHDPWAATGKVPSPDFEVPPPGLRPRPTDAFVPNLGAIKSLAAGMIEPFGKLGRFMMGRSEEPAQDLAMAALGIAAPRGASGVPKLATDVASRMARAEAMGFRTGMPLYHGSGESFSAFRAVPTTAKGMEAPGVSTALDPEVANEFALRGSAKASPQVYPLLHRADNPAVMSLDGSETHGQVVATLRDAFDAGHDAVMLKNYTTPGGLKGKKVIIVRDAHQLRSPNAMFDPGKKLSPELLAGVAGVSTVPMAMFSGDVGDGEPESDHQPQK